MRYALLICNDESSAISEEQRSRRDAAFITFQNQIRARGVLAGGERLAATERATTVRCWDGGDVMVADGPFAETREQIIGFVIVDCKDLDDTGLTPERKLSSLMPGAVLTIRALRRTRDAVRLVKLPHDHKTRAAGKSLNYLRHGGSEHGRCLRFRETGHYRRLSRCGTVSWCGTPRELLCGAGTVAEGAALPFRRTACAACGKRGLSWLAVREGRLFAR